MKNIYTYLILAIMVLCCSGCYDNYNIQEEVSVDEAPQIIFETTIVGFVSDQNNQNIDAYSFGINGDQMDFDQNYFFKEIIGAYKKNQHIDILVGGERVAFANVPLVGYDVNHLDLKIFPEASQQILDQGEQMLELSDAYTLNLDGSKIASNVTDLELSYGSIKDFDLLCQMGIGALNLKNEALVMKSTEVFYFEMADANTRDLVSGACALDYNIQNTSNKIGLFEYQRSQSRWILIQELDEFNGTLELRKMGFYQIAEYEPGVYAEGRIRLEDEGIAFQKVSIENQTGKNLNLLTSANGKWVSFLPAEKELVATLFNPCEIDFPDFNIVSIQGETSFDFELEPSFADYFFHSSLDVMDCEGGLVSYPSIQIENNGELQIFTLDEGMNEILIPICQEVFAIAGYNVDDGVAGLEIPWQTSFEDEIGLLSACEDNSEGYNWISIDDELKFFESFQINETQESILLSTANNSFQLKFQGTGVGERAEDQVQLFIDDASFGDSGFFMNCLNSDLGCGINDFYVSHFPENAEGLMRISFSGEIWVQRINSLEAANLPIEGQILLNQ